MEVHRHLGPGFLEAVYHEAMKLELAARNIPFQTKVGVAIYYKSAKLDCTYVPDLICFEDLIVELKAMVAITGVERSILLNYLKSTGYHRGLLINFGSSNLEFERMVFGPPPS